MGMYAWFTDSEGKKNKTTIAENLDVEVVEPSFPVEGVTDVQPGQTIPKDPAVKNNSDTLTGWLFTEIRVPMATVVVEGAEAAEKLPLFTFTPNAGWKQLQEFEDGDTKVYRFGWEATVEPGGNQTGNIFDEVTFVNLDGSAQGLALSEQLVKVIGYGIQDAEQFEGDVAKAWNAYKLQNGIKDGEGNTIAAALIAGAAGNKLQFVQGTPKVGDMLDAGEVIEVVEDVEHLPVQEVSPLVSEENRSSVLTVEDIVPTKPENTVNWFKDMDSVTEIDITGLDTSEVTDKTGMFDGTTDLTKIVVGETADVADVIPETFDAIDNTFVPEWENPEKFSVTFEPTAHGDWNANSIEDFGKIQIVNNTSVVKKVHGNNSRIIRADGTVINRALYWPVSELGTAYSYPVRLIEFRTGTDATLTYEHLFDNIKALEFVFTFCDANDNPLFERVYTVTDIVDLKQYRLDGSCNYQWGTIENTYTPYCRASYSVNGTMYENQYGYLWDAQLLGDISVTCSITSDSYMDEYGTNQREFSLQGDQWREVISTVGYPKKWTCTPSVNSEFGRELKRFTDQGVDPSSYPNSVMVMLSQMYVTVPGIDSQFTPW